MKNWLKVALSLTCLGALVYLENRRPLRTQKESKLRRTGRNLAVAALSAATIHLTETPIVGPLAQMVERERWGLLQRLRTPNLLRRILAVALMDYTLYLWHILVHRVPLLWRFHAVHHVDLDLDASTALRFHFGEMAISVPYRAVQVVAIGVDPSSLAVWQTFLSLSILFHHSNLRLPEKVENRLSRLIVTPRMHGIHHSNVPEHTNSNWSSGLTIWDMLHGTFKEDVRGEDIDIGVKGFEVPDQVKLPKILVQPFREEAAVRAFLEAWPRTSQPQNGPGESGVIV